MSKLLITGLKKVLEDLLTNGKKLKLCFIHKKKYLKEIKES
jgi:hypothetical protein